MSELKKQDLTSSKEVLLKELEKLDFQLTMKPHQPAQIVDRREQVLAALAVLEAE